MMKNKIEKEEEEDFSQVKKFTKQSSSQINSSTNDLDFEIEEIESMIEEDNSERITTGMRQLSNMKETEAFEYFAVNSSKAEARLYALNEVGMDKKALLDICVESDDLEVRKIALEKLATIADELEDEEFFVAMAKGHEDKNIRDVALTNVESIDKIKEIAKETNYIQTKMDAIARVREVDGAVELEEVYDSRTVINILGAIANTQDQTLIEKIAQDFEIAQEISTKSEERDIKEIAQTMKRDYSRGIVALIASSNNMQQADRLIKAIKSDTQTLCSAIRYCKSKKAKGKIAKILSERVEEIEDERILLTIAKEVKEIAVEKLLVDKIENPQILAKVAKFAKNKRIKAMAKSKAKSSRSKTKEIRASREDFEYEMEESQDDGPKESGKGLVNKIIGLFHELIGF